MKKVIYAMLLVIGAIAAGLLGGWGYTAYIGDKSVPDNDTCVVEKSEALTFSTPEEVMDYRIWIENERMFDSTFCSIPYELLQKVAQVALGTRKEVTIRDIVIEYQRNYGVYKFLGPPNDSNTTIENITPSDSSTSAEAQNPPEPEAAPQGEFDTIINNKKYKEV